MNKVLINFAHPAKARSRINRALLRAVSDLDHVTVNDLYANYPDYLIDIKREQRLCEEHDIIIFQYPFYWYQAPSIIKEWQDTVLEHGWAYGSKGKALKGKYIIQAITAGGDDEMYTKEGLHHFTIEQLSAPQKALANLCKMNYLPPFTVLGIHRGLPEDEVRYHSEQYRQFVVNLRENTIDFDKASQERYCSEHLDEIIRRP